MIEASKGLSLIYKYLKDDEIANQKEFKKIDANTFMVIKDNCLRYEISRDYNGIYTNFSSGQVYYDRANLMTDVFATMNKILKQVAFFKDYNKPMLNIARSILLYNSDNFIKCISRYSISIDDVQNFLSIINEAKMKDNIDLRLLYSSSELINQFYNLSIKCKEYFGYGDFKSVINKLEQLYTFEKEKLDNLLNSKIKR